MGPSFLAVDTETEGVGFYDKAFLVSAAWENESAAFDLAVDGEREKACALIHSAHVWVMHNAKFDIQKLIQSGILERKDITPDRFEDTEGLAHLLNEHRRKGLKFLAKEILGLETDEDEALKKVRREMKLKKADGYHVLPRDIVIPYALKDAEFTLALFHKLKPQLERYEDLQGLYAMEKEVTLVLLDMESAGMSLDIDYLSKTTKEYALEAVKTELDIRDLVGNEDFNPNSPIQIKEVFSKRGITLEKTDVDTLGGLEDPLAERLLHLRSVRKMHGTYLSSLLEEQRDGLTHPWFRQYLPVTGRFSSGGAAN